MDWKNTTNSYGTISRTLHWLMVFLVMLMFSLGWGRGFVDGPMRYIFLELHKALGISVFTLAMLRILWRLLSPPPTLPTSLSSSEKLGAQAGHLGLYIFLLIAPLSGWLIVSFFGQNISFFGLFNIASPLEKNREMGLFFKEFHEILAISFSLLIGVHFFAALYHHFIKKDDILRRMIPSLGGKGR